MQRILSACGLILLVTLFLPGVLALFQLGRSDDYVTRIERRPLALFPPIGIPKLPASPGDSWFARFDAAWSDHIPFRGKIIDQRRRFDLAIGERKSFGTVTAGRDGWLFLRGDSGVRLRGLDGVKDFGGRLQTFLRIAAQAETPVRIAIVPPKQVIYPEMLGWVERGVYSRYARERAELRSILGALPQEQVIPIEAKYLSEKETSSEPVYGRWDTHHSKTGCLVLGKAIIDSLDPTLWNPDEIQSSMRESEPGDLTNLAGIVEPRVPRMFYWMQRPGIQVKKTEGADAKGNYLRPVSFHATAMGGRRLIPGRTVIIQDSFIYSFLHPTLAQFFEDVTFLHYNAMTREDLEKTIFSADRVVFEIAERESVTHFRRLLPLMKPSAALVFDRHDLLSTQDQIPEMDGFVERLDWHDDTQTLEIGGWAALDVRSPNSQLIIRDPFGELRPTASGTIEARDRPDVAVRFPEESFRAHSGFRITIPAEIAAGRQPHLNGIEVYSVDDQGRFRRLRRRDGTTALSWHRQPNSFTLVLRYGFPPGVSGLNLQGNLEEIVVNPETREMKLRGWVAADCGKPSTRLVLYLPENAALTTIKRLTSFRRPDLVGALPGDSGEPPRSGFDIAITLPANVRDIKALHDIYLVAQDGAGTPTRLTTSRVRLVSPDRAPTVVDVGPTSIGSNAPSNVQLAN